MDGDDWTLVQLDLDDFPDAEAGDTVPVERWRRACHAQYVLGACNDINCTYLHDLSRSEVEAFLNVSKHSNHRVFESNSSSSKSGRVFDSNSSSSGKKSGSSSQSQHAGSSVGQDVAFDERLQRRRLQYQQYQSLLRTRFQGMNADEIASAVPLMPSGEPSSIGSVLHKSGVCRPCRNIALSKTCADGVQCLYCHLRHQMPPQLVEAQRAARLEQDGSMATKKKGRPCRAEREEYRQCVAEHEAEIKKDPFNWKAESVVVPPFITGPELVMKFLRRLETIAADACEAHRRSSTAASAHQPQVDATSSSTGSDQSARRQRILISL